MNKSFRKAGFFGKLFFKYAVKMIRSVNDNYGCLLTNNLEDVKINDNETDLMVGMF